MTLAHARYYRNGAYPMLAVEVDGRAAVLTAEPKPALYRAGWVYLGDEFEDVLPPATVHLAEVDGGTVTLTGFSADPQLHRLYTAFLQAAAGDSFTEGPVAIPAA